MLDTADPPAADPAHQPTADRAAENLDTCLPTAADLDTGQGGKGKGIGADQTDQGDPLAAIAAALLKLSPADRQRLAAMLSG